jgi:hypothetical protein
VREPRRSGTKNWTGYLVVLDVWPEVISWGYLLVPKDLDLERRRAAPGGRVPARFGRAAGNHDRSGEPGVSGLRGAVGRRGFIVYSPYNPNAVRGGDRFRVLQRMANPTKCSIFSVIIGQHQRILQWLGQQPMVDPDRIGLYGLSYGGKTAMRVPAVLDGYALSICSGDFNEWIRKIVTPVRHHRSRRRIRSVSAVICSRRSTRSWSSTWATRSTMPRWPP